MSLRSVPPIPMPGPSKASAPHRPRMAEKQPRRLAAREAVARIVRDWMLRRKVSTQELAELAEESASVMHDRLTGEKPMPAEILALLPRADRQRVADLLVDVELDVAAA